MTVCSLCGSLSTSPSRVTVACPNRVHGAVVRSKLMSTFEEWPPVVDGLIEIANELAPLPVETIYILGSSVTEQLGNHDVSCVNVLGIGNAPVRECLGPSLS